MGLTELFILAVGLSMDAFAVSVCKGLSLGKIQVKHMCIAGAWFGGFQAVMPLAGYFLGSFFADMIARYAHWIAFVLLLYLGGNMVRDAGKGEACQLDGTMEVKTMFLLAVATSIDALAVGITFAFLQVDILPAVALIGCTTFAIALAGVWIGQRFGSRFKDRAALAGGMILCLIGLKILLEHLGMLG